MSQSSDVVIIGAGIIGLTIARELARHSRALKIIVLEKESHLGAHASGRNSGIVHAGIYYRPESLRARLCVEGSRLLIAYCEERGLPLKKLGKLIVATSAAEVPRLEALAKNATECGANVDIVSAVKAVALEPEALNVIAGLWSPATAVLDPQRVLAALAAELRELGVEIKLGSEARSFDPDGETIEVHGERRGYGLLVNAAGAHADRIARAFELGKRYQILPFRGAYFELDRMSGLEVRGNIYPVPDPAMPMLGVHFTRAVCGRIFVGPTAMPALGREQYSGLRGTELRELRPLGASLMRNFFGDGESNASFRAHVKQELHYLFKSSFVRAAQRLVPRLVARNLMPSDKRGIRPQLFDRETWRPVDDFVIEATPRSVHILNAISPGLTGSFAFARHLLSDWILPRLPKDLRNG